MARTNLTLSDMVYNVLKDNSDRKMTAKDIASIIAEKYNEELKNKRNNKRFTSDEDFVVQISAEIGSQKESLKSKPNIYINEQIRPKLYYFNDDYSNIESTKLDKNNSENKAIISESSLYSKLPEYLFSEFNIYCKRIDEKTSSNDRGTKGNIWLHPDLVGVDFIDKKWDLDIKECVKDSGYNRLKLYSYEIKIVITASNVRECFFQAVSNSSWANCGFLVATEIKDNKDEAVFHELKMLSSLHGIGFILLDIENPSESQVLLQAKEKVDVDWESINRILKQNKDFQLYIASLKRYLKTGEILEGEWDFSQQKITASNFG